MTKWQLVAFCVIMFIVAYFFFGKERQNGCQPTATPASQPVPVANPPPASAPAVVVDKTTTLGDLCSRLGAR